METVEKNHMEFELHLNDLEIRSGHVARWARLVCDKVQTLPFGEPVQMNGCVAHQNVFASLIDAGNRLVIGSQVRDDLRVLLSLEVTERLGRDVLNLKVTHYYPGRVRKPKSDAREGLVFFAYTPVTENVEETLEMLATITFECIKQKGFNDTIKALFRAPQLS
jgi:hypothetical protein